MTNSSVNRLLVADTQQPDAASRRLLRAITVQRRGWTSIKIGKLLALAAGEFDVLLTADKGMEYQQNLTTLPVSILIVLARSNRMQDLAAAVPAILSALVELPPNALRKVSA